MSRVRLAWLEDLQPAPLRGNINHLVLDGTAISGVVLPHAKR
jgi:hypothetical protein